MTADLTGLRPAVKMSEAQKRALVDLANDHPLVVYGRHRESWRCNSKKVHPKVGTWLIRQGYVAQDGGQFSAVWRLTPAGRRALSAESPAGKEDAP